MKLGMHIFQLGSMAKTMAFYRQSVDLVRPDCVWFSDRLLGHDLSGVRKLMGLGDAAAPLETLDPFVTMTALAASSRVETALGIAVTDFVRRKSPDLARACYSLNQLLEKPLNIGFGSGESVNLLPLGYGAPAKPVSLMEEELERFVRISNEGTFHLDGQNPVTLGYNRWPSRVWIGGQRDRMLRITARYADGWLPAWKMSPDEYQNKVSTLKELARQNARPAPEMGMFAILILGSSRKELLSLMHANPLLKAEALIASGELWRKYGLSHPAGGDTSGLPDAMLRDVDPRIVYEALCSVPDELMDEVMFIGSPEEVWLQLRPYREAGLEHLSLSFPEPSEMDTVFGVRDFAMRLKSFCEVLRGW